MRYPAITTEASGDLFGQMPIPLREPVIRDRPGPELTAARALSRQIRVKQPRAEKQRIAHLICLSLSSMLKHEK
jgi:hypothetical protein